MLRGKMPHFRLTSVAQKRLCLSSLFCRRRLGRKKKKALRARREGEREEEGSLFLLSTVPRALSVFSIIAIFVGIPRGSLGEREQREK